MILALETSCDDTCAAVVTADGEIRCERDLLAGRARPLRGVVPEIASRHHLELIGDVIDDALARARRRRSMQVELVAVTRGPGLVAALLVGFCTARRSPPRGELPLAAVDHLHGHVAASFLAPAPFEPPFLSLIASGGHTLLARRRRPRARARGARPDARRRCRRGVRQGRAAARARLSGRRGARTTRARGRPQAFDFPTAARMPGSTSRSPGLKTALLYRVRELGAEEAERRRADLAASYQRAIVESLAIRVERALSQTGIGGWRSAEGWPPTARCASRLAGLGVELDMPPPELCTDNAAMIASAARYVPDAAYPDYLELDVYATGERRRRPDARRVVALRPPRLLPVRRGA